MKLHQIYHPITATPYKCTKEYMEFPPCDALKPYIRCFWGSREVVAGMGNRPAVPEPVIPDTCMDIIFTVNHTDHSIESSFCGIDDRTFFTQSCGEKQNSYFIFGIRFYPWSVSMFTEDSMKNTKNAFFDAGYHFSGIKKEITAQLFDIKDMYEQIFKSYCTFSHIQNIRNERQLTDCRPKTGSPGKQPPIRTVVSGIRGHSAQKPGRYSQVSIYVE